MSQIHTIATTTHGRYLLDEGTGDPPVGMLVGFHGQSEDAAIEMEALQRIRGERPWLLLSVQGLHRYYNRRGEVVAAWMTRQDRELAIADNIAYVRLVVATVLAALPVAPPLLVYSGFSQGTAMAYRAAAFGGRPADGLIILAGDVPPDVLPRAATLPPVLLGRGSQEPWYTEEKAAIDRAHLASAGVACVEHVFDAGHVRHPSFSDRAGQFLDSLPGGAIG
jgi:predicted esterase